MPGIFQRQQGRNRTMLVIGLYRPVDIIRIKTAIIGNRHRCEHDPAKHRGTARFIDEHMIVLAGQDFLTACAMPQHGAQVRLRPAGHEQCCLFAKHGSRLVLQCVDRGIIAIHIITNLGGHHAFARTGHRVTAHIYARWRICAGHSCIIHLYQLHHGR